MIAETLRRPTRPRARWALLLALLASLALAPAASAQSAPARFTIALDQFGNESFDPFAQGTPSTPYLSALFDTIVGATPDGTAIAKATGLADDWTVSPDGSQITFHLRKATFSDGSTVTSHDVAFSLQQNNDPQVGSPYASQVSSIIKSIDTPDDSTVVVTMNNAVSNELLMLLSPLAGQSEGMVVPQNYGAAGKEAFARNPIGSGPYTLGSYTAGQEIVLNARDSHFAGTPRFKQLAFELITDDSARTNALLSGTVDFTTTGRDQLADLTSQGFQSYVKQSGDQLLLFTPWDGNHDPIMSNPVVRQALSLAINRDELNQSLLAGAGRVSGNFNTSAAIGYQSIAPDAYDPAQAKQLLAQAGIDPASINIQLYAFNAQGWPEDQRIAETLIGYWQNIGVNGQINFSTFPAFRQQWVGRTLHGQVLVLEPMPASIVPTGLMSITMTCAGTVPIGCDTSEDAAIAKMNAATTDADINADVASAEQLAALQRMYIGMVEAGTAYVGDNNVPSTYSVGEMYESFNTRGLALIFNQ